ncbi:MAG TPA: recombinase family protein [Phycisphaerae bacterium]|nr:recombinase family protein [Phycisphaerae bacterium]
MKTKAAKRESVRSTGSSAKASKTPTIRCAIYTRKSSDDGLQQEFNSLDAQREAAEAYIASQKAEGWVCLPERYDDGGFTGGNTERPGLKRLLADIEAGGVDAVVVYKIDRFSRSLADFMQMMTVFEEHGVSFVSVTQAFDTSSSMGRLTLNILLSFAQFEREIIGERIRDKIGASRQRGKWTGGTPILGYDVNRSNGSPKLVVNAAEASRVRQIFDLYVELGTLLPVSAELERRGWCNKVWTTRNGRRRGGLPFDKCRVHKLLTNVLYAGKVAHKGQLYAGEHEAIVSANVFDKVQQQLKKHSRSGVADVRNRHGALLRGLLFCRSCRRAMSHTFTTKGKRRYCYYTCTNAIKRGRNACPSRSLPAAEIERAVIDEIRCISQDSDLLRETLAEAREQVESAIKRLTGERREIEQALAQTHADLRKAVTSPNGASATAPRIAELNDRVRDAEQRVVEIDTKLSELKNELVTEADVETAFADFDNVWQALSPREQVRLVHLLVSRVEYDAEESSIEVTVQPTGIKSLAGDNSEVTGEVEHAA